MKHGNFTLSVVQGRETGGGYVELKHGTQYELYLQNHDQQKRCAAEVKVDGKVVGLFRLRAGGALRLERPSNDNGKFTFYKDGTTEAKASGLESVPTYERGVISVTFKPEKQPQLLPVEEYKPYPMPTVPVWPHPYKPVPYRYDDVTAVPTMDCDSDGPIGCSGVGESTSKALSCSPGGQHVNSMSPRRGPGGSSVSNYSSGGTGLSGQSSQSFKTVGHLDYDESAFVTINLRLVATNDEPRPLRSVDNVTPIPLPV